MNYYSLVVLVSWAASIWGMCSVLHHSSEGFRDIGRSKLRSFGFQALGLIPYLGLVTTFLYVVRVRGHLPRSSTPIRDGMRSGWSSVPTSRPGSTGTYTPASPLGSTSTTSWSPPQRQKCGVCNGGYNPCRGCSNGYVYGTQTERHITCGGTGNVKCAMCNGTGYR